MNNEEDEYISGIFYEKPDDYEPTLCEIIEEIKYWYNDNIIYPIMRSLTGIGMLFLDGLDVIKFTYHRTHIFEKPKRKSHDSSYYFEEGIDGEYDIEKHIVKYNEYFEEIPQAPDTHNRLVTK